MNLTTRSTKVLVVVECLPESEQSLVARLSTGIEQNADFRVENATESSEQPSVRVDLLGVLLLQAKHHLDRRKRAGAIIVRANELLVGRDGQLRGVFKLGLLAGKDEIDDDANLQCGQQSRFRRYPSS